MLKLLTFVVYCCKPEGDQFELMSLFKFLKHLRQEHGITQEEMSQILAVSRPTYSQIESGERELTISEAEKVAGVFQISLGDLLLGNDADDVNVVLEKISKKSKLTHNEIRDNRPQITVDAAKVEKFRQAILYILTKVGAKPNVGETVLYKLLYFIDFDFYEKFEEQIFRRHNEIRIFK
jgi:transcriptional regulator with XRE-family HTH domain